MCKEEQENPSSKEQLKRAKYVKSISPKILIYRILANKHFLAFSFNEKKSALNGKALWHFSDIDWFCSTLGACIIACVCVCEEKMLYYFVFSHLSFYILAESNICINIFFRSPVT